LIRPQRIGEDEGVPEVVFGARDHVAVAEAVELLRVHGEDVEAALNEYLHDGGTGCLDRDRRAARVAVRDPGQRRWGFSMSR
jgi:hypothetical protein